MNHQIELEKKLEDQEQETTDLQSQIENYQSQNKNLQEENTVLQKQVVALTAGGDEAQQSRRTVIRIYLNVLLRRN